MSAETITDPNDEIGLLGVMLGHFSNGTGLSEDEIYAQMLKLQREKGEEGE